MANSWDNKTHAGPISKTHWSISTHTALQQFVYKWVHDYTTPLSNTQNVVKVNKNGCRFDHVIYWHTDTIDTLYVHLLPPSSYSPLPSSSSISCPLPFLIYLRYVLCRLEAVKTLGQTFQWSFFLTCIPQYVRLKQKQDGLCPLHFTAHHLEKEFIRKRVIWHQNCTCTCDYCYTEGCNHGCNLDRGKCLFMTCLRCCDVQCPIKWNVTMSNWLYPVQLTREGGGLYKILSMDVVGKHCNLIMGSSKHSSYASQFGTSLRLVLSSHARNFVPWLLIQLLEAQLSLLLEMCRASYYICRNSTWSPIRQDTKCNLSSNSIC